MDYIRGLRPASGLSVKIEGLMNHMRVFVAIMLHVCMYKLIFFFLFLLPARGAHQGGTTRQQQRQIPMNYESFIEGGEKTWCCLRSLLQFRPVDWLRDRHQNGGPFHSASHRRQDKANLTKLIKFSDPFSMPVAYLAYDSMFPCSQSVHIRLAHSQLVCTIYVPNHVH
jgi:hypothetical protein